MKRFVEAIIFTKTPWQIISDEKYSMVDNTLKLAIVVQDGQRALAGAPVGTPSVCKLPGGPSHHIDLQTKKAESVWAVFGFSIGLMMIVNLQDLYSQNSRVVRFKGVCQMELVELLSVVSGWIKDHRLKFNSKVGRSYLTMLISWMSTQMKYHSSCGWQCLS